MSTRYYSYGKSIWKGAKAAGILGAGVTANIVFPEEGAGIEEWLIFACMIIPPIFVAVKNWWKHADKPTPPKKEQKHRRPKSEIWLFLLIPTLALAGCGTLGQSRVETTFTETISEDGTTTTAFKATSRGEVDASLHQLNYRYGGDENQIIVGQDATGVTSPAQQALLQGWASLIANVPGMMETLVGAIQRPVPAPVEIEE